MISIDSYGWIERLTNGPKAELINAVMLEIKAVDSKGSKYQDTAIAEVQLFANATEK